jgi:hypothetical protein
MQTDDGVFISIYDAINFLFCSSPVRSKSSFPSEDSPISDDERKTKNVKWILSLLALDAMAKEMRTRMKGHDKLTAFRESVINRNPTDLIIQALGISERTFFRYIGECRHEFEYQLFKRGLLTNEQLNN